MVRDIAARRRHARASAGWRLCRRWTAGVLCLAAAGIMATPAAAAGTAPSSAGTTSSPLTVQVVAFDVQGNTLLPEAAVQARLAAFTGRQPLQRLKDAAAAVQELFRSQGYGGVVAFVPEQTMDGGTVRIRVVEGRLTQVDVAATRQFSEANVRASLPSLVTGRTPNVRLIDAEIQLANENPAKTVQVLLQPGARSGDIAAKLSVTEQPVQRFSARLDDTGSERTGRWRAGLGWQHANVFDKDHVFAAELQTAPENTQAVAVLSLNYRAPLYAQAMAVDAFAAYSNVDAGTSATPAGDLSFGGKGYVLGTRLNAYLSRYENIDQRLVLGLEWREYLNNCAIEGLPQGACGAAGESVSVQPLSLSYTAQTVSEVRAGFSVGLHTNLGLGGAHGAQADFEAVRKNSQRRYTLLRLSAQVAWPLPEGVLSGVVLAARLQGQFSGRALVPGELFGIGGAQSVRGFGERELTADSGLQASVEAISAGLGELLKLPGLDLRALIFADAGYGANRQQDACQAGRTECRIGSVGAGLRANWQQMTLRLDVARAMSAGNGTAKGGTRAHFAASTQF
jgi:hemolysin activation/secretion protein